MCRPHPPHPFGHFRTLKSGAGNGTLQTAEAFFVVLFCWDNQMACAIALQIKGSRCYVFN